MTFVLYNTRSTCPRLYSIENVGVCNLLCTILLLHMIYLPLFRLFSNQIIFRPRASSSPAGCLPFLFSYSSNLSLSFHSAESVAGGGEESQRTARRLPQACISIVGVHSPPSSNFENMGRVVFRTKECAFSAHISLCAFFIRQPYIRQTTEYCAFFSNRPNCFHRFLGVSGKRITCYGLPIKYRESGHVDSLYRSHGFT